MSNRIKGISFLNPVDVEEHYLKKCAEYAIEHKITHFELIGPTHSPVRGNCDGMTLYRKYSEFNDDKDVEYIKYCERVVNEALDMIEPYGIKSYYWHHELEVPLRFDEVYPEIKNSDGDVEVTHPRIKDFLENKIEDFFHTYPKMTGIILTLHETRIPLLKLKNQKIGKVERVKYVTEILYDTCKRLGKELIVRPFASIAKDYDDLMDAYEQISKDLLVCDKWTKYDWSLTRPHNPFFARIKNPLVVETDIFGEYFGKGFIPVMLKDHITEKVKYCESYGVRGYVSRIDRGGYIPFGTPNEVNLEIMDAAVDGRDVDEAIDAFFVREYGEYAPIVREAMEGTEELQIKALAIERRPIHWLSLFPPLFSMKTAYRILRDDFVIPKEMYEEGFTQFRADVALADKREAVKAIGEKLALVETLKGKLDDEKYYSVYMRFKNFYLIAKIFEQLTVLYASLAKHFEHGDEEALAAAYKSIDIMKEIDKEGYAELGRDFHCEALSISPKSAFKTFGVKPTDTSRQSQVYHLDTELKLTLDLEVAAIKEMKEKNPADFVIAGGFSEAHNLKNEPNFSGAITMEDGVCRTAGSERGAMWSVLKAHGWFSYDMAVREGAQNTIVIRGKGHDGTLSFQLDIDGEISTHSISGDGILEITKTFKPADGKKTVTVKIERNSGSLPFIYSLMIK
ncbi:MAG: hypothetical protein IKC87_02085 [Clostridia bacterium]|nr:hypothetical protein [Clostridia bacterium]